MRRVTARGADRDDNNNISSRCAWCSIRVAHRPRENVRVAHTSRLDIFFFCSLHQHASRDIRRILHAGIGLFVGRANRPHTHDARERWMVGIFWLWTQCWALPTLCPKRRSSRRSLWVIAWRCSAPRAQIDRSIRIAERKERTLFSPQKRRNLFPHRYPHEKAVMR